jgi:hypothetical protein
VNLSEPVLENATLSNTDCKNADFTDADLESADFSNTDLRMTNLHKSKTLPTELSRTDLRGLNLSEQDLSGGNLSRADLRDVDMVGMSANQGTTVGRMRTGLSTPEQYDQLAQAYHEFKNALSDEGLSQRARQARALEQQARTAEAWARVKEQFRERVRLLQTVKGACQCVLPPWPKPEIRTQFLTAVGGSLSRYLTGYGTRPFYVFLWTAAIILMTTGLFALGPTPQGGWQGGPLYYSVVTFVTAPPHPPRQVWTVTQATVLVETYLGTALIVLLGYVLGTRERV